MDVKETAIERRRTLRAILNGDRISLGPGVANALHARIAEAAGFELVMVTGSGVANTLLGRPDLGFTSLPEIAMIVRHVVASVRLPVVADADTGFGNHLNVIRTVAELEQSGVSGIFIEDQTFPKRCGHFDGKTVISPAEMIEKVLAAVSARSDPELVLVARTDALESEGLESAIRRASLYCEAGADFAFVEAPRSLDDLRAIPSAVPRACIANMVDGGKTPIVRPADLEAMGYRLVAHANVALRAGAFAVRRAFESLIVDGTTDGVLAEMLTWQERQELVGLAEYLEADSTIQQEVHRRFPDTLRTCRVSGSPK